MKIDQSFDKSISESKFNLGEGVNAAGLGALLQYDTRDSSFNANSGRYFKLDAILSSTSAEGADTYSSYNANYRSFHALNDNLNLAWELKGCAKDGNVPLWNACFIGLRGFAATDYIGFRSGSAQAELRWKMTRRWGLVGFAGAGFAEDSFAEAGETQNTPSYGLGVRFMVLESQGINIRVDFARSENDEAVHLSVGEAF